MSHGFTARALWSLEVPPGEILVPADPKVNVDVAIKLSMAAIDPTKEPDIEDGQTVPRIPRSTLKMVRLPPFSDSDSEEDDDEDELTPEQLAELKALINGASDDDDDSDDSDEEDSKAGPSNSKNDAGVKKLTEALKAADDSDEDMEDAKPNGVKKNKGKGKATAEDEEDSDLDDDDLLMGEGEEEVTVLCTLDTERNYQQPLEIIIPADENVGFVVTGTHSVFLSGNLVTHFEDDESDDEDEDDEEYDLEPDSDEVMDSDEESDALDGQRVTEVDSDEEDAPQLVKKKDSKKRAAEEDAEGLEDMIKAEEKLSKKQKKLKNNNGEAVATKESKAEAKKAEKADKGDKKVQFAKNLEQGPTGSEAKKADKSNITIVKGVKIDDRKVGQGRKAKHGDTVGMRYIGKLENGKVFDSNKKGPPFSFKLGKGEVIKGWDIGVAGMAVGGERRLTIPANLAYGSRGISPDIPPNSTLIFDIKMIQIK